jgi:hypothetical protein
MYGKMYGKMAKMRKTTVYLPEPLLVRVKRVARDRAVSEAEVIRSALEEYTEHERPRPRFPLFSAPPIKDWDEAMRGFGES